MLHAPTSETKTETAQSKSQFMPMPERELHPHASGAAGAYARNSVGSATSIRSPEAQQRQRLTGMQSTYGNQAVLRMMHNPQQVARLPMLRPSQSLMLQRQCACGGSSESAGGCAECKAKREAALQRRVANQGASPAVNTAPPIVQDVLRSPGQPLDAGTRAFMEPRFGHDFSHVRIHTDAKAAESARTVDALAYTVGSHVIFGAGHYAPDTFWGRALMAHEFTHVLQQNGSNANSPLQMGAENDTSEQEAHTQSHRVMADKGHGSLPAMGIARPGTVQRFWGWVAAGAAVGTAAYLTWAIYCLSPLLDPLKDVSFNRFIPWMYARYGGDPLPSRFWDAFGHCWIGCEGTKKCGATATAVAGQARELYREFQGIFGIRPHDSYSQDTNNQATGRGFGDQGVDCFDACSKAAATDGLDLSAPEFHCWTPDQGEFLGPCTVP